jgi:LPS O-antigen subunit length determinant protein (WzzB/FepE family)
MKERDRMIWILGAIVAAIFAALLLNFAMIKVQLWQSNATSQTNSAADQQKLQVLTALHGSSSLDQGAQKQTLQQLHGTSNSEMTEQQKLNVLQSLYAS